MTPDELRAFRIDVAQHAFPRALRRYRFGHYGAAGKEMEWALMLVGFYLPGGPTWR